MKTSSFMRPEKIKDVHLSRRAIVYVRQSSIRQVEFHQESTRQQYSLVDRVQAWGWQPEDIETIDEDQGKTGATIEGRHGFQRMMAEVSQEQIGLIIGLDISRMSRNGGDLYRLVRLCELFDTLIADTEGIYDLTHYNDRLILGLKGTISEAEHYTIKQRLIGGQQTKAKRGKLQYALPSGYVWDGEEIVKDPDEEVQQIMDLCFDLFERMRTTHQVLMYLARHDIKLPFRQVVRGGGLGRLDWRRPTRSTVRNILVHPTYAGAYTYGRRGQDKRRKSADQPYSGTVARPREQWLVLIHDHHEAYISWETYERNLKQLESNRAQFKGSIKRGDAMLTGLLRCGRCQKRLTIRYSHGTWRYTCMAAYTEYGGKICQSVQGELLDGWIASLVLAALKPASLDVSLQVIDGIEGERKHLVDLWNKKLERAAYEAKRAFVQYDAVDPQNRLVARNLEKRWEEALQSEQQVQRQYQEVLSQCAPALTEEEREQIQALAKDVEALWHAEGTTVEERQAIVRILIDEIIITPDHEMVDVHIHWSGGDESRFEQHRPVQRWDMLRDYEAIVDCVKELRKKGLTHAQVAKELNHQGYHPPRQNEFTATVISSLLESLKAVD
ncbi:MAG: recombinase family protein, partial [Bradymonadaceae bacterium]